MKPYIAVDIGASSGRLILGFLNDQKKLELKEVHRFQNGFTFSDGHNRWPIDTIVDNVLRGLEKVKQLGIDDCTVGIDTWGVDYCLVGSDGKKLQDPVSYRDKRTNGRIEDFIQDISKSTIYQKTGIQFLEFNTLYQLDCEDKGLLDQTDKILMIPDYIGYMLTGRAVMEATNASTTQFMNLKDRFFDQTLMEKVQLDVSKFPPLAEAGTALGEIRDSWRKTYDLPAKCRVITVATHDTASAVVGTPGLGDDWAFLSSGTWSLLGAELKHPEVSEEALCENYSNEWGAYGTYRFLKNIMGLWVIQEIARLQNYEHTYGQMAELAVQAPAFQQFVNINDVRFTNPKNMIEAVQNYCQETRQKVPESTGELVSCVYGNLALCYAYELEKLESITKRRIQSLHIVGGGSNIDLLNQWTANLAGVAVYAGPPEATAIGNLVVQMISAGELPGVEAAREMVARSFPQKVFMPHDGPEWQEIFQRYKEFLQTQRIGVL